MLRYRPAGGFCERRRTEIRHLAPLELGWAARSIKVFVG